MIKDNIFKIIQVDKEIYTIYFHHLKPIQYYAYKNPNNNYEFCELDKAGRFINRNTTDFVLTQDELDGLRGGACHY